MGLLVASLLGGGKGFAAERQQQGVVEGLTREGEAKGRDTAGTLLRIEYDQNPSTSQNVWVH